MKNILIVENEPEKRKLYECWFLNYPKVNVTSTLRNLLEENKKEIKPGTQFTTYDYVFIHKSFKEPGFSIEVVDQLKNFISNNICFSLISYSGGTSSGEHSSSGRTHHVNRGDFERKIKQFVDFSLQVNQWYKPAFFKDNYKKIYLKTTVNNLGVRWDEASVQLAAELLGVDTHLLNNMAKLKILEYIYTRLKQL